MSRFILVFALVYLHNGVCRGALNPKGCCNYEEILFRSLGLDNVLAICASMASWRVLFSRIYSNGIKYQLGNELYTGGATYSKKIMIRWFAICYDKLCSAWICEKQKKTHSY